LEIGCCQELGIYKAISRANFALSVINGLTEAEYPKEED
jgi:hypothetical protein